MVARTLTLFSVRVSDKPADEGKTSGHGKWENLSAFVTIHPEPMTDNLR
ncbi:MAG TPA: hypothetical protein VI320_02300 [Terracidiphilus sp.]